MAVLLSLATAVLYGSADFCGGLASQRARVLKVLFGAHTIGLIGITAVAVTLAEGFAWRDMWLGGAGGLAGLVGVAMLYRRLALGPMHVVAPLSGVMSAAAPALWGLASGERLAPLAWLGVGSALVAIVLVSTGEGEQSDSPVTPLVIVESLASGLGFGAFFVFLAETAERVAPWPIVASRVASVAVLAVVLTVGRRWFGQSQPASAESAPSAPSDESTGHRWRGRSRWIALAALVTWAGLADTGANASFLLASQRGDLAVVSVLSSLYPVATVVLAVALLGDRMTRRQLVGLGAAVLGTSLIAVA